MKKTKKIMCLVMAIVMCAVMSLSVFALIPGYGNISGYTEQIDLVLEATAQVSSNPDHAKLQVTMALQSSAGMTPDFKSESARGATSYTHSQIMSAYETYPPHSAFITYEVYSGYTYNAQQMFEIFPIDDSMFLN